MVLTVKPTARNHVEKANALKEVRADKMVKLTINIPLSLRVKFKITAATRGTDMSEEVLDWIEEYVK